MIYFLINLSWILWIFVCGIDMFGSEGRRVYKKNQIH